MLAAHAVYGTAVAGLYDLDPMAAALSERQARGATIAHWGKYSGDFQFLGRLEQPLSILMNRADLAEWLSAHPDDYVVIVYRAKGQKAEDEADFTHGYRGRRYRVGLWQASKLTADPSFLKSLIGGESETL